MSGSHPALELVLGENTRRVEGRIYQNGDSSPGPPEFYYTVQSVDAAGDATKPAWPRCRSPVSKST